MVVYFQEFCLVDGLLPLHDVAFVPETEKFPEGIYSCVFKM